MDLKNITLKGDADDNSKLIDALRELPLGTVRGITSYGSFEAKLLPDGTIKMGQYDPVCMDELTVNVPDGARGIRHTGNCTFFSYRGKKYRIEV